MQEEEWVLKYLYLDLSEQKWSERTISVKRGVGGEALAYHLYALHQEEEPLCFALGTLSGSPLPCTNTLSLVGRSIATGRVEGESSSSLFSASLATLPWRAIVLTGVGRRLMSLHISSRGVDFEVSERFLGMHLSQINQELKGDASLAIGLAGEREVPLASIFEGDHPLERWGFGALLGRKNVKALVVERGDVKREAVEVEKFALAMRRLEKAIARSPYLTTLANEGDLSLLEEGMKRGFCGVNNISLRSDPRLFHLTTSEMVRRYGPIQGYSEEFPSLCHRRIGTRRLPTFVEIMALGSNLGNFEGEVVFELIDEATELGLNPISTGVLLGWIMAARQEVPSDNPFKVKFGRTRELVELVRAIGEGRHGGEELSKGVAYLEKTYLQIDKQEKISSHVNGREMLPIDPRGAWMMGLFMALGYDQPPVGEILLQYLPNCSLFSKAEWAVVEENLWATSNSIGLSKSLFVPLFFERSWFPFKQLFLRHPVTAYRWVSTKLIRSLLGSYLGVKVSLKELINIGRESLSIKESLNGSTIPPLPQRFTINAFSNHPKGRVIPFHKLVERYQFLRALDLAKYRRG
ncbi:MAG: aldehyde ferredoxin oxidoreductase N-terminal domain-containing protein [Sphaerochaetaceae bacterium]